MLQAKKFARTAERLLASWTRANLQGWLYPTEGENEARVTSASRSGSETGSLRKRRTSRLHLTRSAKFLMNDSSKMGGVFSMRARNDQLKELFRYVIDFTQPRLKSAGCRVPQVSPPLRDLGGKPIGMFLKTVYHPMSASFTCHGAFLSDAVSTDVARNHSQVSQNRRDPRHLAL